MNRFLFSAFLLSFAFSLGLGGCAQPKVPQEHYYRLSLAAPEALGSRLVEGNLLVEQFFGNGLTAERPLLYSSSENPVEVQQYHYHYWIDTPPVMFQDQAVTYFRALGLSKDIVTPEMRVLPDFVINGRIKRLERVLSGSSSEAVIELEIGLTDAREGRLILTKTYVAEEPANEDMPSVVAAFNKGLADILKRFVADVEAGVAP